MQKVQGVHLTHSAQGTDDQSKMSLIFLQRSQSVSPHRRLYEHIRFSNVIDRSKNKKIHRFETPFFLGQSPNLMQQYISKGENFLQITQIPARNFSVRILRGIGSSTREHKQINSPKIGKAKSIAIREQQKPCDYTARREQRKCASHKIKLK